MLNNKQIAVLHPFVACWSAFFCLFIVSAINYSGKLSFFRWSSINHDWNEMHASLILNLKSCNMYVEYFSEWWWWKVVVGCFRQVLSQAVWASSTWKSLLAHQPCSNLFFLCVARSVIGGTSKKKIIQCWMLNVTDELRSRWSVFLQCFFKGLFYPFSLIKTVLWQMNGQHYWRHNVCKSAWCWQAAARTTTVHAFWQ